MINQKPNKLFVVKRDGREEMVHFDKITSRILKLCYGLNMDFVDPTAITLKVASGLHRGVTTQELDNLAAKTAVRMTTDHPDYAILAARIAVSNLHKETKKMFSEVMSDLHHNVDDGSPSPIVSEFHYNVIKNNADRLNSAIIHDRDFNYTFFGFKTLEESYLWKINGKIVERPQHMLMRVAIGIHGDEIDAAIETYNLMSEHYFSHASSTLFAAAIVRPQLSSYFLLTMPEDSIDGIFKAVYQCAAVSKSTGGVALNIHCIRAKGTKISGTNGASSGLVPMLSVFNNLACYVHQDGRKRQGALAIYLEPWHADIFEFLNLKRDTGKEENRPRDLHYALWIPDLFMKRVEADGDWSLMCPHKCPGLCEVWGHEFDKLYMKYESEGKANKTIKARALWFAIYSAQEETGAPYMLYKDACNRKSNQGNIGTIKCSNFSTEIVEYTSVDEIAVCNLASIALNMFVTTEKQYDFYKLKEVTKLITKNLNKIIDINYYPLPETKKSNMRHRPIAIGVQGFADALILMRYPYESENAVLLNQQIFETIYYGALEASCELAKQYGPYETYEGSPVSKGILQYDMWNKTPTDLWDWAALKEHIKIHGVRNSLLVAAMPAASAAQILGNNQSFEPYTSNVYTEHTSSGEFMVVNHHLLQDLTELNLWNDEMKNLLLSNRGSIQKIKAIPEHIRELYKTVWEISVKSTINMAVDRGAFIDQSQSFNIHVAEPSYGKLSSIHFYGWKAGLKTGMYYLRTKLEANSPQLTVDKTCLMTTETSPTKKAELNQSFKKDDELKSITNNMESEYENQMAACSLDNKEGCLSCGS
uniref:Ribonucleoside-diphosphate reductase n=2 Tax=Glossina brevipalpis TaxID=37001 RepID=A0A1A9WG15_9MUSC